MSIREAFGLTDELEIKKLFPVHWDMFEANNSFQKKLKLSTKNYDWNFQLIRDIANLNF